MKALTLALASLALAACSGRDPEPGGLGKWSFAKTTVAQAETEGRCQPTELFDGRKALWCFGLTPVKIGARAADVDLYFTDGKLIEIQVKLRGCDENTFEQFFRRIYGPPIETKGNHEFWKNSFLWAAAFMPSEPGRCLAHILPLSEAGEIARISGV
ncbi:MAG TPA: hypothetical protein VGM88_07665 [Kofleriaceae bacterium]